PAGAGNQASPTLGTVAVPYNVDLLSAVAGGNIVPTDSAKATIVSSDWKTVLPSLALAPTVPTAVYVVVTAQDLSTKQYYKITATRQGSADTSLLAVAGVVPVVRDDEVTYDVTVGYATNQLTAALFEMAPGATVQLTADPLALAVGNTNVQATVLAQDGSTTRTYDLVVHRQNGAAGLASFLGQTLNLPGLGTAPDAPDTAQLDVDRNQTQVQLSDIVAQTGAAGVTMYATAGFSGAGETTIALPSGLTDIWIKVAAEDPAYKGYYQVTLNRETRYQVTWAPTVTWQGYADNDPAEAFDGLTAHYLPSGNIPRGSLVEPGTDIMFEAAYTPIPASLCLAEWAVAAGTARTYCDGTGVLSWQTTVASALNVTLTVTGYEQRSVAFNLNGGPGTVAPVGNTPTDPDYQVTLPAGTGLTREGWGLAGWNTQPDGQGTSYGLGATYLLATASDVLYAQWVEVPVVKFGSVNLSPDLNGDGRGEVLALEANTGALWRFGPNAGVSKLSGTVIVKSGLAGHRILGPGDWDGDRKADVVTIDLSGNMWLRKGDGKGNVGSPVQIGRGWTSYRVVPAGDLNSDGANDLLAIDTAGLLWLYAGDGKGAFKAGRVQVGKGWGTFDCHGAGDLNQDGLTDLLGINAAGLLYAYMGKGNGQFASPVQVGRGWSKFTLASGGDLNGDSLADIVGRNDTTGMLYYYQSKGAGQFAAAKQLAAGW
ncbi:MAG: FG-GAP-like repeat-containing protein, partial [Bifidobacteriaceae bacterium]|nr:FG-GAP-like repeat-containing protein [Bifidobacteriaceae bacterium]